MFINCLTVIPSLNPTPPLLFHILNLSLHFSSHLPSCPLFSLCAVASDGMVLHLLTGVHRRERGSIIKHALLCWRNHIVPHCCCVLASLCTMCTYTTYALLYAFTLHSTYTPNTIYCKALKVCCRVFTVFSG